MFSQHSFAAHSALGEGTEAVLGQIDTASRLAFFERTSALHGIRFSGEGSFTLADSCRDTPPLAIGVLIPQTEISVYLLEGTSQRAMSALIPLVKEVCASGEAGTKGFSRQLWHTYSFPQQLLEYDQSKVSASVTRSGRLVSSCTSCRENAFMAEAFVKTAPAFQGQGYGTRVTLSWAREVFQSGKTPVFSCNADNLGSMGIASKLELRLEFKEIRLFAPCTLVHGRRSGKN